MRHLLFFLLILAAIPAISQQATEELKLELAGLTGDDYCEKAIQLSETYFNNKDFEKAAFAASLACEEARRIGRKDYMAVALNKEAKATLKNKKIKRLDRISALKKFGESLELMTEHKIDNIDLEKDNISGLQDAGNDVSDPEDEQEITAFLSITIDSIKQDLLEIPGKAINLIVTDNTHPAASVADHVYLKRQQQRELQQKIMEMNLAHVESQVKMSHQVNTQNNQMQILQDIELLPKLKEKWLPYKEELEKEFAREMEKIDKMEASEAKEELLLAEYRNKFDSLSHLHTLDSINLEKKDLALQQQQAEVDRQKARRALMMVGSGSSVAVSFLFLFGFLQLRKNNRLLTRKNVEIQEEQHRSQELLLNILPAEVAYELKEYGAARAHRYEEVTVLFSDFQNFTAITENLSPEKLIADLDYCFKAFDRITEKYELEKIKTIGDAYLCAGGVPSPNPDHAKHAVSAALEMQQFLETWKQEKINSGEEFFEARIGIHTGPIIAGVVGVKKFAYDIWGDTVNIASRMESSGQTGKVNISGSTYALVHDLFPCVHRGKIQVKHKGEIDMYFVES